jgi:pimeloyl-ACP methyl ester carboxylesterase
MFPNREEFGMASISERENREIEAANASGNTPVVFIHGLWLLPSSWDRWGQLFSEAGYAPLTPDWPEDPETVEEARANPDVLAKKTLKQIADHTTEIINALDKKPAVMGHSTGGLLAQMLAGRGLSAATVAIDPGVFRGVLPLPASALRVAGPFLVNPLTRGRAITLTFDQFKYGLIIEGEKDHTVPWAIANAAYKRQRHNPGVTEIEKIPNRGHALTLDQGWQEVAQTALDFVKRFVPAKPS